MTNNAIRVLVADDHSMFVRAITTLLAAEQDIDVVGTAATGHEAVRAALEHRPDVVLMDLHMPDLNGIEATRELTLAAPHVGVLVLTMFDDDDSVASAIHAGARGYLLKGARQEEVARAIRSVHAGDLIIGQPLARRVGALMSEKPSIPPERAFPILTERELAVLNELARGLDNTSIARALYLSEKTVRNYVSGIFAKLSVASRSEAVVVAREAGLGR
jgi:DNA-binding NarL/FixJ family response regulator